MTHWLEVDQGKIAFDVAGDTSASKTLLCINGYQRARSDFRAFRKRFHQQFPGWRSIALDNRGVGETENARDAIDIPLLAADAMAVVHSVIGGQPYCVLGISMGGMIAQAIAAQAASVQKLILVSTTAGGASRVFPERGWHQAEAIAPSWPQDEAGMTERMRPYFGSRFLTQSPLLFKMMIQTMLKIQKGNDRSQKNSQLQYSASRQFDATPLLASIRIPTLIVTGAEDQIIPAGNSQRLQEGIPQAKLVTYPEVGHLILIEEPEKFVYDVGEFLNG